MKLMFMQFSTQNIFLCNKNEKMAGYLKAIQQYASVLLKPKNDNLEMRLVRPFLLPSVIGVFMLY